MGLRCEVNWPRMDSLPPEIFHEILRYVIETQPTDHAVNTRLVNRTLIRILTPSLKGKLRLIHVAGPDCWELSITALLIRSARLETEIGIDRSRARDGRNSRWYPLPARMKMLYMWHKINQHSRAPTVFSVWVETMLELRGIDDSDLDFRTDVIQQLIGGAAVGNLVPAEVFQAAQGLPVEEDTRVPDLLRFAWEPLEKTYWVLIAANAMSMGDAEALDYFLTHGYDMTGLSMRFRVWIMKSRGRVVSEDMVRVLEQHRAPFTFEGLQFTLDRQYLYRAIESGDQAQLNLLLDHLKRCFRRPMGLLVNAGITHARSIGNNNLATALETQQVDDALEEFPNMSSVPWIDARAQAIALDLLFET